MVQKARHRCESDPETRSGRNGASSRPSSPGDPGTEWCEARDISDPDELRDILIGLGIDTEVIAAEAEGPETKVQYRRFTDAAVAAGVFGSPSHIFDGELFWGQDRLDMLEEKIAGVSHA